MTGDLVEWIRAQLAVDEQKATAATPGPWRHNPDKVWRKPGTSWFEEAVFAGPAGKDAITVAGTGETDDVQSMRDAEHIALHDPARVLREVEAKRKVIELYEYAVAAWLLDRDKPNPPTVHLGEKAMAEAVLQALALPYSDRPGYREEWRP